MPYVTPLLPALVVMSPALKTTLKFIGIIATPFVAGSLIFLAREDMLTPLTAIIAVVGIPVVIALTIVVLANTGQPYIVWNAKDLHSEEEEKDGF